MAAGYLPVLVRVVQPSYCGTLAVITNLRAVEIPLHLNLTNVGLQSVPGKMLAWTLQNYGAYIVDSRGSPGFDFSIEDGAAGSKATEFQADYRFPFDGRLGYLTLTGSTGQPTPQAKWVSDIRLIIDYLRVVSNNSPTSIGGGGTPLQPLAPTFQ